MKTENTPENKAKFFAQYWGQEVFKSFDRQVNAIFCKPADALNYPDSFIMLNPISSITDADAIELAGIRGLVNIIRVGFVFEGYLVVLKREGKRSVTKFVFFRDMYQPEIDFLRSKSYLLPYMDLSVEDLISYGWVKIKS